MHTLPRELEPALTSVDPLAEFKWRTDASLESLGELVDVHFAETTAYLTEMQDLAELAAFGRLERQAEKIASSADDQLNGDDLARRIARIEAEAARSDDPELDAGLQEIHASLDAIERQIEAAAPIPACHGQHRRVPSTGRVRRAVRRVARRSTSRGDPDDDEPAEGRRHNLDLTGVVR